MSDFVIMWAILKRTNPKNTDFTQNGGSITMKAFMREFKEFIAKGNVMSMAVGIIVGSAFTAIVTSLNEDIITPLLGLILGQIDFTSLSLTVGGASVMYRNFIQAIITFLITALTLFFILKAVNRLTAKKKADAEPQPDPAPVPEDVQLLTEIRDLLKEK